MFFVQVHNIYMLGIMRYSTVIIQYEPSEILGEKKETSEQNQGT